MASGQWTAVLRHVQKLFQGGSLTGLSEGQLLDRFLDTRDETAFGAIVARHGPMVLGVCRGVLSDPHDVEDAFQATFLILVKKARSLRNKDLLGPWLYGVARRVSLRAKGDASRRRQQELAGDAEVAETRSTLDAELRELQSLIREEVDRLSSHDRMAVVLCYLEGLTHEEAASRLGWPIGTVKGRLSRAREKLKGRLSRRGVTLPTVFTIQLGRSASAIVPTSLIQSTVLAASRLAAGQTLSAGIVSAQAISLMEGMIGTMFTTQLKIGAAALGATCLLAVPGVLAVYPGAQVGPPVKTAVPKAEVSESSTESLAKISEEALGMLEKNVANGNEPPDIDKFFSWSRRLAEAKSGPSVPEADRKAALQAHLDRMKKTVEIAERSFKAGDLKSSDAVFEARYRVAEAAGWVRAGRVGAAFGPTQPVAMNSALKGGGGADGGFGAGAEIADRAPLVLKSNPDDDKRNEAINAKLDLPIAMKFAADTPLEDVKKYIQDATQDEVGGLPTGIPIYIDPEGLQNADKTLQSTISLDLEAIPLRTTLKLLLRQLGLDYRVTGGLLLISDENSIQEQEDSIQQQEAVDRLKARQGGGFR